MSKLGYKTRGDSSPQGKSKVYYCCHPKDFSLYFNEMSKEVLTRYNCAFCYEEEPEQDYDLETLYTDLGRMQLFIVPITADFLYSDNRARQLELEYAKEQHIPILPLLQDSSLAEDFNEICGNLQYLDKNAIDDTASSYEIKLEKFLAGALIKDEEAEEVRKAFDTYIFLSYRKKDRKYAQELMRMIHKIDFCRDVAIWYDEFLSPGENFNGAIGQALEKSQLFLMAVTPNLVNEENYVASIEYPMAERFGKPILPVELIKTDRKIFEERFDEKVPLFGLEDTDEIARFIWTHLENARLWSRAHFADHDYLIGLAYLNGIDVEVDYQKGIDLIKGAAERGYEKAILKMIDIYEKGIGVKSDFTQSVYWYEKLVAHRKDICENKKEDLGVLLDSVSELILKYNRTGDYEKALEMCYYMKKLAKMRMIDCLSLSEGLYWYSVIDNHFARIHISMGKTEEARKYLKKSLGYNRVLLFLNDEGANRDRAVSYVLMADAYDKENNRAMKQASIEKSIVYFSKNIKEKEEKDGSSYMDLMYTYRELAISKVEEGDIAGARQSYGKAVEAGEMADCQDDTFIKEWIIDCTEKIADLLEQNGYLEEASNYYESALHKKLKLDMADDEIRSSYAWADYYEAMSRIRKAEEKWHEEQQFLLLEMDKQKEILRQGTDAIAMDRCMLINMELGRLHRDDNESLAREYFEKAEEIRQICAENNPEERLYMEMKAYIYEGLAYVIPEKEKWYLKECLGVYERLLELNEEDERYQKRYQYYIDKVERQL